MIATQWIGGKPAPSQSTATIPIRDPADETVFAEVPRGCAEDANAAISAARRSQPAWAKQSPSARGALLRQGLNKLLTHRQEIAELITREVGKPLAHAKTEVDLAASWTNSLIELGMNLIGRSVPSSADELVFQHCSPRGVAVCLNTWNAPVVAGVEMAVANLIVGNTVVLKTSERAPLATRRALELFDALPPGGVERAQRRRSERRRTARASRGD